MGTSLKRTSNALVLLGLSESIASQGTHCNFERTNSWSLKGLKDLQLPNILHNISPDWRAHATWDPIRFVRQYGHLAAQTQTQLTHGPDSIKASKAISEITALSQDPKDEDEVYLSFGNWSLFNHLKADISPFPNHFKTTFDEFTFTLGNLGKGSGLHTHDRAWVTQIAGRKMWLLAAPNALGLPEEVHPCSLLKTLREADSPPASLSNVHFCEVGPGETIYVPAKWYHGTCNMENFTLGVGGRGKSPLQQIDCLYCNLVPLQIALEWDIDLAAAVHSEGLGLLHTSAKVSCISVMKYLIQFRARVNAEAMNRPATPLWVGAKYGHMEVAKLLIEGRADVNRPGEAGSTPLLAGIQNGHMEVTKLLVEDHADVNLALQDAATPLLAGTQNGDIEVTKLLIEGHADVNLPDQNGMTPLAIAIQLGHKGVAKLLIQANADTKQAENREL